MLIVPVKAAIELEQGKHPGDTRKVREVKPLGEPYVWPVGG